MIYPFKKKSMKVLCLNAGKQISKNGEIYDASGILIELATYTVIRSVISALNEVGYILEEVKSTGLHGSFNAARFALLSNIDEMGIANKQKVKSIKALSSLIDGGKK